MEPFNVATEEKLATHPLILAAEAGTMTVAQRRAFAAEQLAIQRSDAASFATLAGHKAAALFAQSPSLLNVTAPPAVSGRWFRKLQRRILRAPADSGLDFFQFLLGGEVFAAPLLAAYAKSVGFDSEADMLSPHFNVTHKGQAYPSYWARLALANQKAAGAAACAVNFPAWGRACKRLREALSSPEHDYYTNASVSDGALAFLDFFATPIDGLDDMASAVIDSEGASFEDLLTPVRLLQEFEVSFWDAVYEAT